MSTLLQNEIVETVSRLPERKKREVLEFARNLHEGLVESREPIAPRRVRIVACLESLRNCQLELVLDDGSRLSGRWLRDSAELRLLVGQRVLIEGRASFDGDGDIVAIEADAVRHAHQRDAPFAKRPIVRSVKVRRELAERRGGLRDIVGKWPGDETDEEIAEWLDAIS